MKISKLIELLQPHADLEAVVEYYDSGTGDPRTVRVSGVRFEVDENGTCNEVTVLL